jgi:hypothetical protein
VEGFPVETNSKITPRSYNIADVYASKAKGLRISFLSRNIAVKGVQTAFHFSN